MKLDNAHPVRIGEALHARLENAASERGLSVQFLVNKLLAEALDRLIPAEELSLTRYIVDETGVVEL